MQPSEVAKEAAHVVKLRGRTGAHLNVGRVERDGYFRTIKPTWPYLLRLFPRFSDAIRKSPSSIYQLLSATFTAPERVIRSGFSDLSCDPFNPNPLSKQSLLSFCKQYLNYVDNYGKEYSSRNLLVPKEIYRMVMFLFLLNVVFMMVLIWTRVFVYPAAIDSFSRCLNSFGHTMMNLEQTSIPNPSDMPAALRVEIKPSESSLYQ